MSLAFQDWTKRLDCVLRAMSTWAEDESQVAQDGGMDCGKSLGESRPTVRVNWEGQVTLKAT